MVRHLATYIKDKNHCRGCNYRIDIKTEVERFRQKYPNEKPKIVFDFMGCISMTVGGVKWDVLTGGRQLKCTYFAEEICKKFKNLDVELIFFCDGPIKRCKIPHYIESANHKYQSQQEIFNSIKKEEFIKFFVHYPKLSVYTHNFLTTIRKYSKISISFSNECDVDIANYATKINALAVISCDTDFLIFPGDWQIWSSKSFYMGNFSIFAWNKLNLRKRLNLRQNHMPIFSILSGNDFVKYEYVQYFHKDSEEKPKQKNLAEYILTEFPRGVPLRKDEFNKLSLIVYNHGNNNIKLSKCKELVSLSLNFYDYEKRETDLIESWLKKYTQSTNSIMPYMVLKNLVITINQSFIDMSIEEFKPFSELALPIVLRQIGLLLDYKREQYPEREICFKPNHQEPFQIKKFHPIYNDEITIPPLQDLLQTPIENSSDIIEWNNMRDIVSLEIKFKLFCWVVSPKEKHLTFDLIKKITDSPFFISIICLYYLVKEHQITIQEADILLLSLNEAKNMDIEKLLSLKEPDIIKPRDFWISSVFNRLVEHFRNSLIICGLFRYIKISYFDGFIFHKMSQKFETLADDIKLNELKKIKNSRIYVESFMADQ